MSRHDSVLTWQEVFWPSPLSPDQAVWLLRRLASDRMLSPVVIETVAVAGCIRYLVGSLPHQSTALATFLENQLDHVAVKPTSIARPTPTSAAVVRFRADTLPLDSKASPNVARDVLAALAATRADEHLSAQIVLWRGVAPHSAGRGPTGSDTAWWADALRGILGMTPKDRGSVRVLESGAASKAAEHGFVVTLRIGVTAPTSYRREQLALGLLGAFGTAIAPGVRLDWRHVSVRHFYRPLSLSWVWPSRDQSHLSVSEIPGIIGLPIGVPDADLPGLPPAHPKLLPLPQKNQVKGDRTNSRAFAVSDAPATLGQLVGFSTRESLTHLSITAPTGAGKSTLLWHLIHGDMASGAGVVVIDPKGDLVQSVLSTIPKARENDVVILDPTDWDRPVGFNPLAVQAGESAEITADAITSVFTGLWPDTGIRTFDVLSAAISTLTKYNAGLVRQGQPNAATLLDVPRLLSDPAFQRRIMGHVEDDVLSGFWATHNAMSSGQQIEVISPVMRRLRQFLSHASLRAILGQAEPRVRLSEVFATSQPKVLLVPLNKALLGSHTATLFGSLVISRLWHETLSRARRPADQRRPASIIIDEAPEMLHLPLSLGDALAQARGYGVGLTLVSQFHRQWPSELRDAIDANTLSKICFRLPSDDAKHMSKTAGGDVLAEDFLSLNQFQIYASLADAGHPGDWFSARTLPPPEPISDPSRLRQLSRERYGKEVCMSGNDEPSSEGSTTETNPPGAEQPGRRRRPT